MASKNRRDNNWLHDVPGQGGNVSGGESSIVPQAHGCNPWVSEHRFRGGRPPGLRDANGISWRTPVEPEQAAPGNAT